MNNPWENIPKSNDFADLDGFSDQYAPEYSFKSGIDSLPDNDYDCQILEAKMDRINSDLVVRINLQISNGPKIEWTHWLNKHQGVNALSADLAALGFDADRWGPKFNRPLSVEIPAAIARLAGIKFRARKTSRKGKATHPGADIPTYHDFRAMCRLDTRPMPPVNRPPVQTPTLPPSDPLPSAGPSDDEIPF